MPAGERIGKEESTSPGVHHQNLLVTGFQLGEKQVTVWGVPEHARREVEESSLEKEGQ